MCSVWAMNHYVYILRPDLIDPTRAGLTSEIKSDACALVWEQRNWFPRRVRRTGPHGRSVDQSTGDVSCFHGRESILVIDVRAYTLGYFGGLIKP
jgi:hypothetical protein